MNSFFGSIKKRAPLLAFFLSFALTGCGSVASEYDVDSEFTVTPKVDGTFFWWSEITLEQDVNSFGAAHLGFVRVSAAPPATDLTFLKNVLGEAVTGDGRTPLVSKDTMPKGEPDVLLDVLYNDDLRPFFKDGHTVRVEWTGSTDPSFLAWPPDGINVSVKVRLKLD